MGVDSRIARRLQEDRIQDSTYTDVSDAAATVNEKSLFVAGLLTYGIAKLVHAPRTTTDIAWHTTESIFITSATATIVRGLLGRSRPFVTADSDAYDYKPGKGFSELSLSRVPVHPRRVRVRDGRRADGGDRSSLTSRRICRGAHQLLDSLRSPASLACTRTSTGPATSRWEQR